VRIECSRCRAVFSLQDGVAPAGSRFDVRCGRCHAVFEAVAIPRSVPPPAPEDSVATEPDGDAPQELAVGDAAEVLDSGDALEWTPEPAETVTKAEPPLALAPQATGPAGAASARLASRRARWALAAAALALALAGGLTLCERLAP